MRAEVSALRSELAVALTRISSREEAAAIMAQVDAAIAEEPVRKRRAGLVLLKGGLVVAGAVGTAAAVLSRRVREHPAISLVAMGTAAGAVGVAMLWPTTGGVPGALEAGPNDSRPDVGGPTAAPTGPAATDAPEPRPTGPAPPTPSATGPTPGVPGPLPTGEPVAPGNQPDGSQPGDGQPDGGDPPDNEPPGNEPPDSEPPDNEPPGPQPTPTTRPEPPDPTPRPTPTPSEPTPTTTPRPTPSPEPDPTEVCTIRVGRLICVVLPLPL